MSFQLLNSIIKKEWAIDPDYVNGIMPFLTGLINGNSVEWGKVESTQPYSMQIESLNKTDNLANAQPGSIAVINISGPMQKNDQFCGPVGTATIGKWIQEADANTNIDGIILQIDSPGGTVDGTENLASIIGKTKKPIVAYVDGMAASAAYWVSSASDKVIASGKTAIIGSIGTAMRFADLQPVLEKAGVKFHEIYASKSVDKSKDYRDARAGNYTTVITETLDPMNEVFLSAVKKARSGKINLEKENVLTGKTYLADAALSNGLIDSIGGFDTAVQSIRDMVDSKKKKRMSNATKYAAICAALGFENGFESTAEGIHLQESHLDILEAALGQNSTLSARVQELETAQTTQGEQVTQLNQQITSLTSERDGYKVKADLYDKSASGNGSQVTTGQDAQSGSAQEGKPSWYVPDGSEELVGRYKK